MELIPASNRRIGIRFIRSYFYLLWIDLAQPLRRALYR